jgi:hypothetical protein
MSQLTTNYPSLTNSIYNSSDITIAYPSGLYANASDSYMMSTDITYNSKLTNLTYNANFSYDENYQLLNNLISISQKTFTFECDIDNNGRIEPYELIMKMIADKMKFDIDIDIDDLLTIKYTGVRFKNIKNNFTFENGVCNFNNLQVKIKYENMTYDNHNLSITEKRKDKLKKLMKV